MGLGGDLKNRVTGVTRVTVQFKCMILIDLYRVTQLRLVYRDACYIASRCYIDDAPEAQFVMIEEGAHRPGGIRL